MAIGNQSKQEIATEAVLITSDRDIVGGRGRFVSVHARSSVASTPALGIPYESN